MSAAASQQQPAGGGQPELYFKIVCDPGHERTARELQQLPRESRERVWGDMTGDSPNNTQQVVSQTEEDLGRVAHLLDCLDAELSTVGDNPAWKWALQTKLAHDRMFRLMFLRAEFYDASRAAQRMVRHFENKMTLFGREKLDQPIQLKDLNGDDMESLSCGGLQFLPRADRAGRLVFVTRYRNFVYKEKENMLRALWYMLMSVLENPNAQNIGIVTVGYEVGDFVPVDYELTRQMFRLVRNLPIRVVASHSCYSDTPMQKVMDLVVHMISTFARLRFRVHNGSHQECRYRLLTMGIPVDFLPVSMNGVLNIENHKHWLQYRIQQEQRNLPRPTPHAPSVNGRYIVDEEDTETEDMMM